MKLWFRNLNIKTLRFIAELLYTMPHCMVPGCTNHSRKTKLISYHRVPIDKQLQKAWIERIQRDDPCKPFNSYVCSEHFTPDCFEENLREVVSGYSSRRRLKPNSVPSIFSRKRAVKPRATGERRNRTRSRQEVFSH